MNKTIISESNFRSSGGSNTQTMARGASRLRVWALLLASAFGLLASATVSQAQTATLLATNQNIFVGANYNGIYTNSQLRVTLSGTGVSTVTLSVSGVPTGATILFGTNGYVGTVSNPFNFTNSLNPIWYSVAVTNVAKGVYPLTFSCSGAASASATVNLIVGALWTNATQVGSAADVQWSTGGSWTIGSTPGSSDDVIFADGGGNTNYMNNSVSVASLTFLPQVTATNQNILIAPGQTLSVLGTNGFTLNNDTVTVSGKSYSVNIFGPGAALVVSNTSGIFSVNNSDGTGGGTTGNQLNMTNLDNFSAIVNRFGLADWTMVKAGGVAANELSTASGTVGMAFAKTNFIAAYYAGDYGLTNFNPTFAISLLKEGDAFNNGSAQNIQLGVSNVFLAESLALAQNRAGGNPNNLRFNPVFTNSSLPVPYVLFRNTNGGRMNLVGVGIDSGTSGPGSNTRGVMNFSGGNVDMLVDTMWLGRDRNANVATNSGAIGLGVLTFTGGKIDVNYLRAGYMAYTNNSLAQGQINVGGSGATTATLTVNSNLELGYSVGDFFATLGGIAAGSFGQVVINTNGIVRANMITVGAFTTNNFITINAGGLLDVTNNIADTNKSLQTLTFNGAGTAGAGLTLHINGTSTLVYTTNLVTSGSGNAINIGSVSGISSFPATISVISYANGSSASLVGGTVAGGLNASVNNNTANKTIDVTLTTGTPKALVWVGNVGGGVWDTTTTNWIDTATGLRTNFSTGDNVIFDDSASNSTVTVAEDVVPRQSISIIGMAITNNVLAYTFTGSHKIAGSASLVKAGTATLEIDNVTEVGAQITQGILTGSGSIGSVSVSSGATMSYSGTINSGVTCAGVLMNNGTINNGLALQAGAIATNFATVNGSVSTATNTLLVNGLNASLRTPGSFTIVGGATFINRGWVGAVQSDFTSPFSSPSASAVTVNGGGIFEDTGEGALTVNGVVTIGSGATFIPGGDGIGTTTVFKGATAGTGRVLFSQGSTNIFKVDLDNGTYTKLGSGAQDFGGSASVRTYNGGIIQIVNIGTTQFAAGNSFTFFVDSANIDQPPIQTSGSATNTFPVMSPAAPANGLAWNIFGITTNGTVNIVGVSTNTFNLSLATYTTNGFVLIVSYSTNNSVVTTNFSTNNFVTANITWPATNTGWRLQQLQTALTNGLSATNWTDVFGSAWTNNMYVTNGIATNTASFFRMVYP